ARAKALRDEHKYAEAVEILDRIRQLDPKNSWAAEQHSTLRRFVLLLDDKAAYKATMAEEERQMAGVRWAAVPWYELLRYPRDWAEITLKRQPFGTGEGGESEANRAVHRALRQVLPKLNFSGIALGDVIQFIRDVSNTSIHVKWEMLRQANIDQKTPVNVQLSQVTVEKALRTILDDVGAINPLGFIVDEGVITISTKDDLATLVATRVYDIRDLIFTVPRFRGPRISLSSSGGNNGGNNGGSGLFGNDDDDDDDDSYRDDDDDSGTMSRQELIDSILDLIRTTIAPETWRGGDQAGTTGSIRELNGQVIVTQTPENHRKLQDLLAQLREARALLINVEARFITVNTGFLNRIGIDLDFYFNLGSRLTVDRVNFPTTSAIDPVTGAVVPNLQPSTWTATTGKQAAGTNYLSPMGIGQGSYPWVTAPMDTGLANSIGAVTNSAMSFAGTFLDDVQVDFLVSATQAHQSTRTLTAPRVTIFNGQRAYVAIQEQQAYVSELQPEVGDNVVAFTPIISTVSTGSVLDVEGTISADRRYVNLTLRPQVSTIIGFIEYLGDPTVPGSGLLQLPNITLQEVQCTVSVPDGGTLLLGGQRLAGEREREMGVPVLSRIPVINRAFENRQLVRDQQTLLMLVKPKIIVQSEYEQIAHPPR
ncbi:MAG: type II secretion system protein GspD, partial [Planctomycetota bacterium]